MSANDILQLIGVAVALAICAVYIIRRVTRRSGSCGCGGSKDHGNSKCSDCKPDCSKCDGCPFARK